MGTVAVGAVGRAGAFTPVPAATGAGMPEADTFGAVRAGADGAVTAGAPPAMAGTWRDRRTLD